MKLYVVFYNHEQPRTNTVNIHKTSCGHYKKFLTPKTQNTDWEEVYDISTAEKLARQLNARYNSLGIKFAGCCMKEYLSRNPVV